MRLDASSKKEPGDKLIAFIEKNNPDLILLNPDFVARLAEKGKLLELDPIMNKEKFDVTGIPDNMMDFFRKKTLTSILNVAQTMQLQVVDPRREKLQLDSPGWKQVYRIVTEVMKNKALYTSAQETLSVKSDDNPFSRGEIAMQIHAPMASKQQLLGQSSAKLGVVTMPINPENPDVSPFISLDDMYAIHTFSDHKELAWRVLDYMISP